MSEHAHPVDAERVDSVRAGGLTAADAETLAGLLTLLADPLRLRLLDALVVVADEMCVGDLAFALGASEDAASYGLRLLRTAGLVRRRRQGRMGYYRLSGRATRAALSSSLAELLLLSVSRPQPSADAPDEAS